MTMFGGKHNKKDYNTSPYEYLDDDDLYAGDTGYDFFKPLVGTAKQSLEERKKNVSSFDEMRSIMKEMEKADMYGTEAFDPWVEYRKTGVWRGYSYVTPKLDIRYISQMAGVLSSQYDIKVETSNAWAVDLEKKVLYYDPYTLIYGSKANLITSLLHEIGHIQHTARPSDLVTGYLEPVPKGKTRLQAFEVLNCFEDFRIDKIMSQSYPSAAEVYEANKPIVQRLATRYADKANTIREETRYTVDDFMDWASHNKNEANKMFEGDIEKNPVTIPRANAVAKEKAESEETLYDYIALMLLEGYDQPIKAPTDKMQARIDQTRPAIAKVVAATSTHEVHDILEKEVYPVIKDLFNESNEKQKEIQQMMQDSGLSEEGAKTLARHIQERRKDAEKNRNGRGGKSHVSQNPNIDKQDARYQKSGSDRGNAEREIDLSTLDGSYKSVKETVKDEIFNLRRKLTLVERRDLTQSWEQNKKRGKLSTRHLYRVPSGNYKVFKKKEDKEDTVKSYAFSIVIDVSGSMHGQRMGQATRAAVIMADVFDSFKVPFEVVLFEDTAKHLKKFTDQFDSKVQRRFGELARYSGGSTNLHKAFEESEIIKRPEKNKIMVVITDGDVGSHGYYSTYLEDLRRNNVQTIGIGLVDSGDRTSIHKLLDEGQDLDVLVRLPAIFSEIVERIGKSKKGRK